MEEVISNIKTFGGKVKENVEKVIVGKGDVVELVIVALLCEGHVLIEDIPGVGKTVWPNPSPARWAALFAGFNVPPTYCPRISPAPISLIKKPRILSSGQARLWRKSY